MALRFFNTLSRSVEEFVPLDVAGRRVGMYCCGPTVYDFGHIGNFRTFVFSDMVQVVRSRPGATPDDAFMDAFAFARFQAGDATPRTKPAEIAVNEGDDLPLGLVLDQDFKNFARSQRGMHQPGLTHLTVSPTEECRVVNLHRTLEEHLGIGPEDG